MKKRIAYGLASVMALSSIGPSVISISAQTEQPVIITQDKEIRDPQDFVDLYCSFQKKEVDQQGVETVTYTVYDAVTPENLDQILQGKIVYDTLKEDMQQAVNQLLQESKIEHEKPVGKTFLMLYEEALQLQEELKAKEEASHEEENKADVEEGIEANPDPETEPDVSDNTEKPSEDTAVKPEETPSSETTDATEENTPSTEKPAPVVEETVPVTEEKPAETVEETTITPVIEPKVMMARMETKTTTLLKETKPVQPVTSVQTQPVAAKTTAPKVEPTQTTTVKKVELSSMDAAVQSFVKTYLMDGKGNLYTSVNTYNYRQILSGVSQYTDMSTDKIAQLNAYLTGNGSQKYFSLVSQAQKIENQGGLSVKAAVDTAQSSGFGLYGALLTMSGAAMAILLKKIKGKKA